MWEGKDTNPELGTCRKWKGQEPGGGEWPRTEPWSDSPPGWQSGAGGRVVSAAEVLEVVPATKTIPVKY